MNGNIILDCQIKIKGGLVDGVNFLSQKEKQKGSYVKGAKKDINALDTKVGCSEKITWAIGKRIGLQLIGVFEPCKPVLWEKLKWAGKAKQLYHAQWLKARDCSLISALHLIPVWVVRNVGFS